MPKLIDITGKAISGEWGDDDETGNGIPVLRTTNFTNDGFINFNNTVTRTINKKNIDNKYLKNGDIIIEKSGGSDKQPVGRVVYFDAEENKYLFNNFTGVLRVKDPSTYYPRFIFYVLFYNYLKGGTIPFQNKTTGLHNLKTDDYVNMVEIPLFPYKQQQIFVAALDKVQAIISYRKKQLAKLDELVKARFVEMFGDPVENPLQWDTMPLESACCSIVDCPHSTPSYTFEDTGYMCIRTSIVKKNSIIWDNIEYIPKDEYEQRIKRRKPQKGDIIYTREGAILGIAAIIDRDYNVALGQRSMLLSPDMEICLPEFISNAMNFDSFFNRVTEGVSGSASPHINVADIRAFNIMMPPLTLQKQFAALVEQTNKSKVAVQKALDEAQLLFDSLMQEYFG